MAPPGLFVFEGCRSAGKLPVSLSTSMRKRPEKKSLSIALAVVVLIIPAAFIADRNVKITLRTKVQIAAVVVAGLVVLVDQNEFRIGVSLGWIARRGLKTGKALVQGVRRNARGRRSRGVIDVEQPVRRITGVKREAEQTALVAGRAAHDPAGNIEEDRARGISEVRDDRNATALFDHKEPIGFARWRDDRQRIGERQVPKRIRRGIAEHRRRWGHSQGGI